MPERPGGGGASVTVDTKHDMPSGTIVERGLVVAFFAVVAGFGLLVYDDYGITWDEPGLVHYGNLLLEHFGPGGEWETYSHLRYYGPVGPLVLAATDRLVPGPALPAVHLANFAFFMTGVAAFYALCRYQFASRLWGLAGAAALVLSPRVFAHGMVNPKDMPLMTMFIVAVYLLVRYLDSRNVWWIVACGAATGLAFDVRISGAFVVALVTLGFGVDLLRREQRLARASALHFVTYLAMSLAVAYALWPLLWTDPIGDLRAAFELMTNFLAGPPTVLYRGEAVDITALPWHYLPVWIGITTPPLYLLLGAVGLPVALWGLTRSTRKRFFAIYLAWLFVPLVGIAIRRTPLYETWRQALFVYPALLLLTVAGARAIVELLRRRRRAQALLRVAVIVTACAGIWIVGTMFRLHPYQAAYFNVLAGDPNDEYEVDYWGVSYAEGQERLLRANEKESMKVFNCSGPPADALEALLSEEDAARIEYVPFPEEATYSMCTPRPPSLRPTGAPVFTIERDDVLLLEVFRLR